VRSDGVVVGKNQILVVLVVRRRRQQLSSLRLAAESTIGQGLLRQILPGPASEEEILGADVLIEPEVVSVGLVGQRQQRPVVARG